MTNPILNEMRHALIFALQSGKSPTYWVISSDCEDSLRASEESLWRSDPGMVRCDNPKLMGLPLIGDPDMHPDQWFILCTGPIASHFRKLELQRELTVLENDFTVKRRAIVRELDLLAAHDPIPIMAITPYKIGGNKDAVE